ncbi:hypothetical protein X011_10065 [Mycobacterium tuberculosis variant microti OV254]|nr:hypothetical protein X011_10065 [Mycobacterium tuberculosis variant microti OV254]
MPRYDAGQPLVSASTATASRNLGNWLASDPAVAAQWIS